VQLGFRGHGFVSVPFAVGVNDELQPAVVIVIRGIPKIFWAAVCISTGIFNSPAFFQIGSSLASFTSTRAPLMSFTEKPRL